MNHSPWLEGLNFPHVFNRGSFQDKFGRRIWQVWFQYCRQGSFFQQRTSNPPAYFEFFAVGRIVSQSHPDFGLLLCEFYIDLNVNILLSNGLQHCFSGFLHVCIVFHESYQTKVICINNLPSSLNNFYRLLTLQSYLKI